MNNRKRTNTWSHGRRTLPIADMRYLCIRHQYLCTTPIMPLDHLWISMSSHSTSMIHILLVFERNNQARKIKKERKKTPLIIENFNLKNDYMMKG